MKKKKEKEERGRGKQDLNKLKFGLVWQVREHNIIVIKEFLS
jgi:hypothetical protein